MLNRWGRLSSLWLFWARSPASGAAPVTPYEARLPVARGCPTCRRGHRLAPQGSSGRRGRGQEVAAGLPGPAVADAVRARQPLDLSKPLPEHLPERRLSGDARTTGLSRSDPARGVVGGGPRRHRFRTPRPSRGPFPLSPTPSPEETAFPMPCARTGQNPAEASAFGRPVAPLIPTLVGISRGKRRRTRDGRLDEAGLCKPMFVPR